MPQILVSQYDRKYAQPIETFRSVASIPLRNAIPSSIRWEGMFVYVVTEGLTYALVGGILDTNWVNAGATLDVTVENVLTSNSTVNALSANMGKTLNEQTKYLSFADLASFPVTGDLRFLYVAEDSNFLYRWNGTTYVQVGGGGGAVDSVFGRTGVVTALLGDYSSFYVQKTSDTMTGQLTLNNLVTTNTGDNATLINFNTERPWQFKQGGTGAGTTLDLRESTGSKSFNIGNDVTTDLVAINSGTGNIVTKGQLFNYGGYNVVKDGTTHVALMGVSGSLNQYLFGGSSTGSFTSMDTFLRIRRDVDGGLLWQDTTASGQSYGFINTGVSTQSKSGILNLTGGLNSTGIATFGGGSSSPLRLSGTGTGIANILFIPFFQSDGTTRQGYVGFPTASNSHLYLRNDVSSASYQMQDTGLHYFDGGNMRVAGTNARIEAYQDSARYGRLEGNTSGGALVLSNAGGTDAVLRGYGDSQFPAGNVSSQAFLSTQITANVASLADNVRIDGYGLMGNRATGVYITNAAANGTIRIGNGGIHNINPIVIFDDTGMTLAPSRILNNNTTNTRDKIRVWSSASYSIGMGSNYTFGGLSTFAMTFQFDNSAGRGWWWGNSTHANSSGCMALTNDGKLTVSEYMRLGYGQNDTTTPGTTYRLQVNGTIQASNFILSSDRRFKTIIEDLKPKTIPVRWRSYFYEGQERRQVGVIADELQQTNPEFVIEDDEGLLSVDYIQLLISKVHELEVMLNEHGIY